MEPDKVVIKGNPPDDEQEPEDLAKDKEKEAQPQAKDHTVTEMGATPVACCSMVWGPSAKTNHVCL